MSESTNFDEDTYDLFEDENASKSPSSKGLRPVPSRFMDDFLSWTARHYPHIADLGHMDYNSLKRLLYAYMQATDRDTYTVAEWWKSLQEYL